MNVADWATSLSLNFTSTEVLGRPATSVLVAEIRDLREKGATFKEIADHLNMKNWTTIRENPWTKRRVALMVRKTTHKSAGKDDKRQSKW